MNGYRSNTHSYSCGLTDFDDIGHNSRHDEFITLVNTIFLAGKVRLVSGVFKGAESESDISFFKLALVLEISQGGRSSEITHSRS